MEFETTWPLVLVIIITLMCGFYLWEVAKSWGRRRPRIGNGIEGFVGAAGATAELDTRLDDRCYDAFYAKVYDPLVQPTARAGLETQVAVDFLEKSEPPRERGDLRVLDLGCGTGLHVELFARMGVRSVVGYDRSAAMIEEAQRKFPERDFRTGDITNAMLDGRAAADMADIITMFYFTIYTIPDRAAALKNIYLWLAPGGIFVCHIVNKHKFDPVLESASPFVGFSVQKYADERITKSAVTFEEFEYTGDFQLHGSRGMFEEEFVFPDGRRRRHEQRVWMPNIDALVAEIEGVGFRLATHQDMTAIGYEYNYLFIFQK